MIRVTVHDVMLRAPQNDPDVEWLPGRRRNYKLGFARVILLKEQSGDRILPIWVSAGEGDAIAMLLEGLSTARPGTFELTAKLLEIAKLQIEKVAVTALRENIYYATMWIKIRGKIHEIDARPSDAVALSLRVKAPIFVTPEVLESNPYLVNSSAIISGLDQIHEKVLAENRTLPEEVEMEWRSFRSLPRGGGRWLKEAEK
jgi:bifunctional DNase/RNase